MAGSRVTWDLGEVNGKLASLNPKFQMRLGIVMDKVAGEAQDHMRSTAPWTDRTSNARNGLFTKGFYENGKHTIVLYHTVPYGIYLETRWSGKYAVINPSIQVMGPRMMQLVNKLIERMSGGLA